MIVLPEKGVYWLSVWLCVLLLSCMTCLCLFEFFFLLTVGPSGPTRVRSSAASDVYKRQVQEFKTSLGNTARSHVLKKKNQSTAVSYTHLRDQETTAHMVGSLRVETKNRGSSTTVCSVELRVVDSGVGRTLKNSEREPR